MRAHIYLNDYIAKHGRKPNASEKGAWKFYFLIPRGMDRMLIKSEDRSIVVEGAFHIACRVAVAHARMLRCDFIHLSEDRLPLPPQSPDPADALGRARPCRAMRDARGRQTS